MRQLIKTEVLDKSPEVIMAFAIPNIPEIKPGDNIGVIICHWMSPLGGIQEKDIFVVASKIVSKAENRYLDLSKITPSEEALALSERIKRKSPQFCQVIIDQSKRYFIENEVIVARHNLGFSLTSAGVDYVRDNLVMILPADPDVSAEIIMNGLYNLSGKHVGIVISDSEGRADRRGAQAVSIGVAGIDPLRRVKFFDDKVGRIKETEETVSDLLACQAALIMGQKCKNIPVVCIRGFHFKYNLNANLQSIIHTL